MGSLSGKKALVTGGGGGIGASCARVLAEHGAHVVVADKDEEGAHQMAEEVGGEGWVIDLSDPEPLENLLLDVDIIVNNAGFQSVSPVEDFAPQIFRQMWSLMVQAPFLLTRAALPHMYQRGFGRIINISSVHGLRASAYKAGYVSAKHALEGFSKVVALEGADRGVTSNCVNPGYVRTPLVESQVSEQALLHNVPESEVVRDVLLEKNAIKRLIEPDEVAHLVRWLASEESAMVTGASYSIDGGWTV
jgi:3-hydroxybutyrate dehydrogenase